MKTFFKILFSDPKLDLSSSTAAAESIKKILEQEKIANRFKVIVAIGGLCSTLIVLIILFFCYQVKLGEQTILGAALSTLIAAMALEDATDSQIRLLESLQSKIKNTTDDEMRAKTLDALFKIIDIQSFPQMKQFKYLIYLLAAIAAPLWLALTNMGGKSDSKTTFALDSANFQLISKIIEKHDSSISVREKSNGVDKNKSSIEDSLILLLTNALLRGPQKSIDGDGLKIISSTIEKSSKELQAVLMSEKSIKVDVDPITVNHSSPPLEPKIDSSRNVVYNYDLNENGPYPLLKIKATSNENKLFIILSNQSKKFHVVIDTLIPIFDNAYDFSILDSMFIKGSLGSKKLTSKQIQVAFSSAKDLQVKKDTSKLQPYVTINYNLDGNLIDPGNHSIIRLNSPSNNFQQFYIILYYETSRTNLLGSTFTRFVKHRVPVFIN